MRKRSFNVNSREICKDVITGIFDLENIRSGEKFKADREHLDTLNPKP